MKRIHRQARQTAKLLAFTCLGASSIMGVTMDDASAGFQWTAPVAVQRTMPAPAPVAPPAVPVPNVVAVPQVAPAPVLPAPTPNIIMPQAAPVMPAPTPNVVMSPAPATVAPMQTPNIVFDGPAVAAPSPIVPEAVIAAPAPAPTRPQFVPQQHAPVNLVDPVGPAPFVEGPVPHGLNASHAVSLGVQRGSANVQLRRQRPIAPVIAPDAIIPSPVAPAVTMAPSARPQPIVEGVVAPAPTPAIVDFVPSAPVMPTPTLPAPTLATPAYVPQATMAPVMFENAVGFGSDIPMMTAIKQIVPAHYGFAFAPGVPLDQKVSWQGGRPWNDVLGEVLAAHGLGLDISNNVVTIRSAYAAYTPSSATIPAPVIEQPQPILQHTNAAQPAAMPAPVTQQSDLFQPASFTSTSSAPYEGAIPDATPTPITPASAVYTPQMQPYGNPGAVARPFESQINPQVYNNTVSSWSAPKDAMLREVLNSWTRKAGVELFWASEYDYPISTAVNIEGDFEEAVQELLNGLTESNPKPLGRLHPNLPNGPSVLVIETRRLTD